MQRCNGCWSTIQQLVCLTGRYQGQIASNLEAGLVCYIVPAVVDTSQSVSRNSWLIGLHGFITMADGRTLMCGPSMVIMIIVG
jgi:hypothetical protein